MGRWSPAEEYYLRVNYDTMTYQQIALALGRKEYHVRDKCVALGLKKRSTREQIDRREEAITHVREEYLKMTPEQLEEFL